jgi:hypothetical protein
VSAPLVEGTNVQPQVRVTVELPASEGPASWDRKGAEELAKALQQTGQFEVATVVSTPSSAFAGLPPPEFLGRVLVMTATQNQAMDAKSGGVNGYSADDAAAEIVTAELLRRGYRVVARDVLNTVLREQGLQQSGMVDQATAVRVGKLAGADATVIANVDNASINYHQGFQSMPGNSLMDWAALGDTVDQVNMTVKMIDTQTAEVVWLEDKSAQSKPGEQTSHVQLLRDLVAAVPFPSPDVTIVKTKQPRADPKCEKPKACCVGEGMTRVLSTAR